VTLVEKVVALHAALEAAAIPHAFGGALALAWCTDEPRGTVDVDLNVLVGPDAAAAALAALPAGVSWSAADLEAIARDGQVRLRWDRTPVDLFFDTTGYHLGLGGRLRREPFGGLEAVPFLGCTDLAVFKAFFDRTKDWADLEAMVAVGSIDVDDVADVVAELLGDDDPRLGRLRSLRGAADE
jgi:hypothetical protein